MRGSLRVPFIFLGSRCIQLGFQCAKLIAHFSVQCQKGTVQSGPECVICPENQYMDEVGQVGKCKLCPNGTITMSVSASSLEDCTSKLFTKNNTFSNRLGAI